MTSDEYQKMREENTKEWIIEELEKRVLEKGLAVFNLRTLRESLLKNQIVASRTHLDWQPAEVQDLCFLSVQSPQIKREEFCEFVMKSNTYFDYFSCFLNALGNSVINLSTNTSISFVRVLYAEL